MEGRNAIVTNLFGQRAYHQRTSTQGADTVRNPKSDKKKKMKDKKSKKERKAYGDSDNDSSNSDEEEISSPAIII